MPIFIFRVSSGREKGVAKLINDKANNSERFQGHIYSVVLSEFYKGYLIVEGPDLKSVERVLSTIRGVSNQALQGKAVPIEEFSDILVPRPAVEGLAIGDTVEIITGPFKGSIAKLTRIDSANQEVTAEISNSMLNLPITIHADAVRKVSNQE